MVCMRMMDKLRFGCNMVDFDEVRLGFDLPSGSF